MRKGIVVVAGSFGLAGMAFAPEKKTAHIAVICDKEIDISHLRLMLSNQGIEMDEYSIERALRAMVEKPDESNRREAAAMVLNMVDFPAPCTSSREFVKQNVQPRFKFQYVKGRFKK